MLPSGEDDDVVEHTDVLPPLQPTGCERNARSEGLARAAVKAELAFRQQRQRR